MQQSEIGGGGDEARAYRARLFARSTPPHTIRPWPLPRAQSQTIEALRRELADASEALRTEIVAQFRDQVTQSGTPLIEECDDSASTLFTFVWFGQAPHGVVVQLNRITDTLDVEDTKLEQIEGSEVYALTLRLPSNWLGSYLFVPLPQPVPPAIHTRVDMRVVAGVARFAQADAHARERIPSKAVVASGAQVIPEYGVARGPLAPSLTLWNNPPTVIRTLTGVVSPVTGAELALHHYAMEGTGESSPVIVFTDGEVWREQFPIAAELEAQRERGEIPAAHLLFLDSGGPLQREIDYAGDDRVTEALLKSVHTVAGSSIGDGPWIVVGQSLGGLFAAECATRHPKLVSAAIAQSPSLWFPSSPSPWDYEPGWFEERAGRANGAPILLEAGTIDAGVVERCRAAAALLTAQNSLIEYNEYPAGHDVLQWQATLPKAIAKTLNSIAQYM
ncbi:MAG: alpha/beta fold hydrolase [Scrofimicrobium sp.]